MVMALLEAVLISGAMVVGIASQYQLKGGRGL